MPDKKVSTCQGWAGKSGCYTRNFCCVCQGRGCCTASSRVAAALAVAAESCELFAGKRLRQGLAGGARARVVAGSWKGAATLAVTLGSCELPAGKRLQVLTRGAQAGAAATVQKRREGWRRHRWRHFTTAAAEHFLCNLYHRHSSYGSLNQQVDGAARGWR